MNTITKLLIALTIFTTLLTITLSSSPIEEKHFDLKDNEGASSMSGSPLGAARFLADTRGLIKCDQKPRLCRAKGSPGPDCCNKKCVNVDTDKQNCGLCGTKCRHVEICCDGSCVNPLVDKNNCGECNYVCNRGDDCVQGMCNYA
ncbi:hypothetical protein L2E82_31412 [Cichorium intybus]|uniref:Uncharacterized protein n=1 Tax=Cichorium intybus TaxID=13427 RepID=A0ACB9D3S4_CICIN|nr:hypothetical protein L1887_17176 [Cichorium endivia]KAI3740937.1 hypothetical protein L2E82_31412 [Cichorium intybus]